MFLGGLAILLKILPGAYRQHNGHKVKNVKAQQGRFGRMLMEYFFKSIGVEMFIPDISAIKHIGKNRINQMLRIFYITLKAHRHGQENAIGRQDRSADDEVERQ